MHSSTQYDWLYHRNDRKAKETQAQLDEERSNSQRLQTQVDQLNSKMKSVRRDKEEAEGEVETMQKKLRQLRQQLEESEENNSTLQAQMSKLRSASRRAAKVCLVQWYTSPLETPLEQQNNQEVSLLLGCSMQISVAFESCIVWTST